MAPFSGLWKWLGQRFTKSRASRIMASMSIPYPGSSLYYSGWTQSRTEQVKHLHGWTYVSIKTIGQKLAQLSPEAAIVREAEQMVGKYGARRYQYKGLNLRQRRKALTQLTQAEDLEPLPRSHPLVKLLKKPNEADSAGDFFYELVIFLYLTGNAYVWLPPSGFGLPAESWILPSHWIWPKASDGGLITHYEIRPVYQSTAVFSVPAEEVVHIKFKSPVSKIDGLSPTTAGARWIDNSEAIEQSRWHSFANLAQLGPMLLLDEQVADIGPEDVERIEQRFMSRFSGPQRAGRPIILRNVKDIKPYSNSPREMDYAASSDQHRDYVLGLFGVPRQVAGFSEGMTYGSNIAVLNWFCSNTINPLTHKLGEVYTEHVAPRFPQGRQLRVYWPDASLEDPEQKLRENQAYLAAGVITPNEVRQELGLEPFEGFGDDPILPAGVAPVPVSGETDLDLLEFIRPTPKPEQPPAEGEPEDTGASRLEAALRNGHAKVSA